MGITFSDDEPIMCDGNRCNTQIVAGEEYIKYDGLNFCCEDCLKNYLLSECNYEYGYLMTAEDKRLHYQDLKDGENR